MDLGKDTPTSVVEDIIHKQKANQCASLVYTVSTQPKAQAEVGEGGICCITHALLPACL